MRKILFLLILLISSLFFSSAVYATTIFSPILEIEVEPGETQNGIVKVYNETDDNLFLVSSVEPFAAKGEDGQPIYLLPEEKHDFLNWFIIDQDSIVLKSHQVIIIPFRVEVPLDAISGGYYSVIFWEDAPELVGQETGVGIKSKVGTLIFLKVKGDIAERGEIVEFNTKTSKNYFWQLPITFVARFSNTGNVHLRPTGTIEIKSWFGQTEILEVNLQERFVLPDSIRRFEVVWGEMLDSNFFQSFWGKLKQELNDLSFGKYTATLNLVYGSDNQQTITKQISFWLIPIHLIIMIVILIIIISILIKINSKIKKLKRKVNKIKDVNNK